MTTKFGLSKSDEEKLSIYYKEGINPPSAFIKRRKMEDKQEASERAKRLFSGLVQRVQTLRADQKEALIHWLGNETADLLVKLALKYLITESVVSNVVAKETMAGIVVHMLKDALLVPLAELKSDQFENLMTILEKQ